MLRVGCLLLCTAWLPAHAQDDVLLGTSSADDLSDTPILGDLGTWRPPSHQPDDIDGYVVGGNDAPQGRWPDTVYVDMGGGACTGTLIHPKWVLTAAHCLGGVQRVLVGEINSSELLSPVGTGEQARVVREVGHPQYSTAYDIALLELENPITTVAPRIIGRDCITEEYVKDGEDVWIVGWGATSENGTGSTSIQQEGKTTIDTHDCSAPVVDGDMATGCFQGIEIGAGGEGVDACFGDSGGPLYIATPKGTYVIGVTSRAYAGVPPNLPCAFGGIWTRPDAVMAWIEETIGETLPPPTCVLPPLVELGEISLPPGGTRIEDVQPPEVETEGREFEYAVLRQPLHGHVTIDSKGKLAVSADYNYQGIDSFVFAIMEYNPDYPDAPPLMSEIPVQLDVTASAGCSTTTGMGGSLLVLSGLWGVRRRKR